MKMMVAETSLDDVSSRYGGSFQRDAVRSIHITRIVVGYHRGGKKKKKKKMIMMLCY